MIEEADVVRPTGSVRQGGNLPGSGGVIKRLAPDVVDYYGRSCDKDPVHFFREADIWYDAFACVTGLIGTNPQDRTLHDLRSELLGRRNYLCLLNR